MKDPYEGLVQAVITGDVENVKKLVHAALDSGIEVTDVIDNGLLKAMHVIGDRFEKNEIYVTELLVSARGVHEGMNIIRPYLISTGDDIPVRGKILIGTVAGDLHDIGKNLLALVLEARGFEVIDLGVDVSSSTFVEAVSRHQPDVLCLSSLLTTTVSAVGDTIKALSGVKHSSHVSVVVGGAALKQDIASAIGADGYAPDAISGAKLIGEIIERNKKLLSRHSLAGAYALDEIAAMQLSFKELTGLDIVFVDKKGVPFIGGEAFASCSAACQHWSDELGKHHFISPLYLSMTDEDPNKAVAYRCRCGLMEISYPMSNENVNLGTLFCGHFLLENDLKELDHRPNVPILTMTQCDALCRYLGMQGKKVVELIENVGIRRQLEGQQKTFVDFMKKQKKLEDDLKEAELTALQYQVTPHFLFNSLNTIARVALIEGDKHTEKLVSALARLMRYSLYQVKNTVTLEEEVKTVSDYLMIQETRFQGRISHRIDVEPSILMAKMPCMILQPLVENACQHGLEPTKRGGIISIQGWLENGNIFLEVSDNGVGMSEEQKRSIFKLENIHSTKGDQVSGLGMNNVLSRLQFYFGSDCAWDISSVLNKGTTLQLSFPFIK